ncbi:MAG: ATP-binding protein, partial [Pseudomonadota bacterium]
PNAAEKGIQYDLVCELPVRQAAVDETRLTQIIVNLLANAIKFTQAGRVSLTATTTSEAGRVHLSVAISDTGIGIPPAKLDQIFEKFTQLGGVAGACSEGVGLGLSIAMSLTELMGGTLSVRSKEGEGSVFTLQLSLDAVQSGDVTKPDIKPDAA